jgi:DNA primase
LAKESIRKKGFVVVAEGNLDVISSHQAGVANVVASAGTAMTEQHLKELKRFTGDIRLSFDADRAGINATERVIPIAQKVGVSLRIISLPGGAKDPDELIKRDIKAWQKAVEKADYAADWLIDTYKNQLDLTTAAGKTAFTDALLPTIRTLNDPVEQEHYLKTIANLIDSSLEAVKAKLQRRGSQPAETRYKKAKVSLETPDKQLVEYQRLQDHFLAMALMQPQLRDLLTDCYEHYFSKNGSRELLAFLKKNPDFKGDPKIASALQQIGDYVKIITLQFEELYQDLDLSDLREQAINLKHRLIDRYVKIQKHKLAQAMAQAKSETELKNLVQKADKLNELIKR